MYKNDHSKHQRSYRHITQDMRIILALTEEQLRTISHQETSILASLSLRMQQLDQLISELTTLIDYGNYMASAIGQQQHKTAVPLPQQLPELDSKTFCLRCGIKQISLTRLEYELLHVLINHPRQIFSRQAMITAVYGSDKDITERVIDSHIKKLRKKYQQLFPKHNFIKTVYGLGYSYNQLNIDDN